MTLKHVYGSEWLFKLLNLLEEPDMPGIGYSFDSQVSRIQVSLKNISIDYKPVNFEFFFFFPRKNVIKFPFLI